MEHCVHSLKNWMEKVSCNCRGWILHLKIDMLVFVTIIWGSSQFCVQMELLTDLHLIWKFLLVSILWSLSILVALIGKEWMILLVEDVAETVAILAALFTVVFCVLVRKGTACWLYHVDFEYYCQMCYMV